MDTDYQTALHAIAYTVKAVIEYRGFSVDAAVDTAAAAYVDTFDIMRKRTGVFAAEVTSEQKELIRFHAQVAQDVLDGDVSRPSVGNVRDYLIGLLEEA